MTQLTCEELVEQARRVARDRGAPVLSKKDFTRVTGITDSAIYRLFPEGGWHEVLERAGLERHRTDHLAKVPTREDIVEAAKRAASGSKSTILSRKTFARLTRISVGQIYKLFPDGGWREVLELAGLEDHPRDMAARPKLTRDDIVEAAKGAAIESGHGLSKKQFTLSTGIGHRSIDNHFPDGGWHKIQELAGLGRHPQDVGHRRSDVEILEEVHRVVTSVGHFPSRWVFTDRANFSSRTLDRRFGGMEGAERRYTAWLKERERSSPPLSLPPGIPERKPPSSPSGVPPSATPTHAHSQRLDTGAFESGETINFRGLVNAPCNEQGVILLFGMVCYELGFQVEAIRAAYPDCKAKRLSDPRRGRWKTVHIEFEYRSREFVEHSHDPAACDFIVCWEDNWRDCPLTLKVVELRSEIMRLRSVATNDE